MLVQLTGDMSVEGRHGRAGGVDFPGRQGRLVFACLAVTGQPLSRETLAERIWQGQPPRAWERDLAAIVSRLRSLLTRVGLGGRDLITTVSTAYHLRLPPGVQPDVTRAGRLAGQAEAALRAGEYVRAVELAGDLTAIAARPFLPGEEAPWIDEVRAGLGQAHLRGLQAAAAGHAHLGHHAEAVRLTERALGLEPFHESGHRLLMRIHLDHGDRAQAIRVYERCRRLLADELGLDPSPQTQALHLTALRSDPPPATTERPHALAPHHDLRFCPLPNGTRVAYLTIGRGPALLVPATWISHLDLTRQEPAVQRFLAPLAQAHTVVSYDAPGCGLSDPCAGSRGLADDLAVLTALADHLNLRQIDLLGISMGAPTAIAFAARSPERVRRMVIYGGYADGRRIATAQVQAALIEMVKANYGLGSDVLADIFLPDANAEVKAWFARLQRDAAPVEVACELLTQCYSTTVGHLLERVRAPTLVLHRRDDRAIPYRLGRELAAAIPSARLVTLAGRSHYLYVGDTAAIVNEIMHFLDDLSRP